MNRLYSLLAALVLLTIIASPAAAYRYWGSKPLAMGGAFSAVGGDVNSMHWNPAAVAFLNDRRQMGFLFNYERQAHLLGDYDFAYPAEFETKEDEFDSFEGFLEEDTGIDLEKQMTRDWYHVAIADGYVNPLFTMGVAFTGLNFPTRTFEQGSDYSIDLTFANNMAGIFSWGGTFRWIDVDPTGGGEPDLDLGILINAADLIGIAVVGRNLAGNDEPMIVRREVALGVAGHALDYATISIEATKVFDVPDAAGSFNFGVGVEGKLAKVVALRAGYHWDQVSAARVYSAGVAYVDKVGDLGYSFQGDVDQIRNYIHSINVAIYFP